MGLSSPEKTVQRRATLEKEIADHPFRDELLPMIEEACSYWDDIRKTNDPWSVNEIEVFIKRCVRIKEPMDKFRERNFIKGGDALYQQVIVFTNRWHVNLLNEGNQRLREDLLNALLDVGRHAGQLNTEIRRYLGANIDGYVKQGERYNEFNTRLWMIIEDYKEIERINNQMHDVSKESIDIGPIYRGDIAPAADVLKELREIFFKHGDHFHGKQSALYLKWTLVASVVASAFALANLWLEVWKTSQTQKVEVQLEQSVNELLKQGGMIRLPKK